MLLSGFSYLFTLKKGNYCFWTFSPKVLGLSHGFSSYDFAMEKCLPSCFLLRCDTCKGVSTGNDTIGYDFDNWPVCFIV